VREGFLIDQLPRPSSACIGTMLAFVFRKAPLQVCCRTDIEPAIVKALKDVNVGHKDRVEARAPDLPERVGTL
jgi:hypothetical protein